MPFPSISTEFPYVTGDRCWQSSTYDVGVCAKAVDGNLHPDYYTGESCSHTLGEAFPIWGVDLQRHLTISYVEVVNRNIHAGDIAFPARLKDFRVLISDTGFPVSLSQLDTEQFQLCGQYPGIPPDSVKSRVKCPWGGITGSYVYITLPRWDYLTLCEVQVYGSKHLNEIKVKVEMPSVILQVI